eukprot:364369-Chlamydomonas_euryale.AAC.15
MLMMLMMLMSTNLLVRLRVGAKLQLWVPSVHARPTTALCAQVPLAHFAHCVGGVDGVGDLRTAAGAAAPTEPVNIKTPRPEGCAEASHLTVSSCAQMEIRQYSKSQLRSHPKGPHMWVRGPSGTGQNSTGQCGTGQCKTRRRDASIMPGAGACEMLSRQRRLWASSNSLQAPFWRICRSGYVGAEM